MPEARDRLGGLASGLDIHYDLGEGYPLLGRRMPDLDVITARSPLRVYTLLHAARPVLLNFGGSRQFDIAPWADRVQAIDATYDGAWELPVIGAVTAPSAVLIRPDGYVAWVGNGSDAGLRWPRGLGRLRRQSRRSRDTCRTRGARKEFRRAMTDQTEFGPAKSLANAMLADGVDVLDQAAVDRWIEEFNTRPFAERGQLLGNLNRD